MVYYGEWQQLADYDTVGEVVPWADGTSGGGAVAEFWDDPDTPSMPLTGNDAGDMNLRLDTARAVTSLPDVGPWPIQISGYLPNIGQPLNGYRIANGARRFGPPADATDAPTWLLPRQWPDGATGYEFASDKGAIVTATLELGEVVPAGTENKDVDSDADGRSAAIGGWDLALLLRGDDNQVPRDYEGIVLASWDYPGGLTPVTGSFDVTSVVADNDGRFILLGSAHASVQDFDRDETGHWGCSLDMAIVPDNPAGASSPGYGACSVKYLIRPPLFRWIYAAPPPSPGLPPLRQFPRDDTLATSSASRAWSSSQQGSLRQHGYF